MMALYKMFHFVYGFVIVHLESILNICLHKSSVFILVKLCDSNQVYELTLHYTQHRDHNVVTASLELLQQLFRTPSPELLNTLIIPGKIAHTRVFREEMESRARSGSIVELIGTLFRYL